jgi:hypothetical protein
MEIQPGLITLKEGRKVLSGRVFNFSFLQEESVWNQLVMGARFLDVEVKMDILEKSFPEVVSSL